jgi:peptidoglycan/LPS O-acetylase OafA/YrhL
MCFFIGGVVFFVYEKTVRAGDIWKVSVWLPFLTIIAWLVTIASTHPNYGFTLGEASWIFHKIVSNFAVIALFPMTIMSLALIETKRGTLGKRLSFIGDISYSSYLLHFPLQLATVIITSKLAVSQELFYSPWFMAIFFFVLILTSLASHRYFEIPMQHYLRLKPNPAVNTDAAQ